MLKYLINIPVRFLDRILRFPSKPKVQQTRMVLNMYKILQKTYEAEVSQGIFAMDVKTAGDLSGWTGETQTAISSISSLYRQRCWLKSASETNTTDNGSAYSLSLLPMR